MKGVLFLSLFLIACSSLAQDSTFAPLDEFEEFTSDSVINVLSSAPSVHIKHGQGDMRWPTSTLLFTILAGILVRYKKTRQLRALFLVASVAVFGFYRGGCPCSIQSLQNGVLFLLGSSGRWQSLLLFAGLIPVTYFFGRVYCGWICHLGALQEFIFKTSAFKLFQNERAQKIMRGIRIAALIILISQLLITQTNLYKEIDPFAIIFNFSSEYATGWILVAIVVFSSAFLYRPFCKTVCPVGLTLGWISEIPGASVLGAKQNCNSCLLCHKSCDNNAITHENKISILQNQECIRCGECINGCRKNAIGFFRKSKKHPERTECKPIPVTN